MAWGRLDDQANGNAKLLALSDTAFRMWACGLIYCQANLTDGFIPEFAVKAFGVRGNKVKAITELCAELVPNKGVLWHASTGGYTVHDFLDWNDSRGKVLKDRADSKARLKQFRGRRPKHVASGK